MEESKSYSIDKLTESNYLSWSQVIESHLNDQGLWDIVTGIEKKPTVVLLTGTSTESEQGSSMVENAAAMEEWLKKGKKARKVNYLNDQSVSHGICRGYERPCGNVEDSEREVQA